MENIFYIQKAKIGWNAQDTQNQATVAKAKTKREVLAKTIVHAKTIGSSRIVIFDKDGNVSEERTIKKAIRK